MPAGMTATGPPGYRALMGLVAGPLVFLGVLVAPAPSGLTDTGWHVAGLALLMALWWITEAVPIPVTALLPLIALPLLGVGTMKTAAAPYASPVIFLFLGGFILAAGLQTSGLHRRLALAIVSLIGTTPSRLVAGFMAATAFTSMWVSNTATVMMMLPIAASILAVLDRRGKPTARLAISLLLGIAYAANIGGLATLIGTPPNALLAGFMEETYGITLGFARWMALGLPLVAVALPLCWLLLTRVMFPPEGTGGTDGSDALLQAERRTLGPVSGSERIVAVITVATAAAWVFRPLLSRAVPGLTDAGIAIAGATLLFVVPLRWPRPTFLLRWSDVEDLPWGVLILFGGGISLAAAIRTSGLADWIGQTMSGLGALPVLVVVGAVTTVIVFLTEINSNTATAATFLPVVAALATGIGIDPLVLAAPTALAASCAFMLPVATPPNAIVYASERVPIGAMVRAGLVLNGLMIVLITGMVTAFFHLWGG